ncbi:hypothetical protein H0I23_10900 [Cellulophaga sp. HaHaR_3_176]|uniref:hypothetical protein n=1 Tax=Cellulophaga sp. HaHaR_3_176 TaxID=1942464 RepID=UPI001C1F7538|nr:hypothetical protein [Cellulophaga sp. HaHaR_3_176]QWX82969.1 hypothetical protein H0I23_10900 [Cellulophaga sp. HaHaR_3_176]
MNSIVQVNNMRKYTIIKRSNCWSSETLRLEVEQFINEKNAEGYEIVTVSFGTNLWYVPTAYVTLCK